MEQHFTLGAGPVQIMGQHVLPRLYGCRRLCRSVMLPINEYDDDDDDDDKVFCKFVIRFFFENLAPGLQLHKFVGTGPQPTDEYYPTKFVSRLSLCVKHDCVAGR